MIFVRTCKHCGCLLHYRNKSSFDAAELKGMGCKPCADLLKQKPKPQLPAYRQCPKCNEQIKYKTVEGYKNAVKNNSICKKCMKPLTEDIRERNCPSCNCVITYPNKHACKSAEKAGRRCHTCAGNFSAIHGQEKRLKAIILGCYRKLDEIKNPHLIPEE